MEWTIEQFIGAYLFDKYKYQCDKDYARTNAHELTRDETIELMRLYATMVVEHTECAKCGNYCIENTN